MNFFLTVVAALGHNLMPADVDSLLTAYDASKGSARIELAQQIVDSCLTGDVLTAQPFTLTSRTPRDTADLWVWYAAERYYFGNSYFKESIEQADRALPLARHGDPSLAATLLCDRGYGLSKLTRNTEAVETVMEAVHLSRQHGLTMQQARAYNYLAIIDLVLGYIDEAKHFVVQAIETDRKCGTNVNTHNYLGIACEVFSVAKEPEKAIAYGRQAVEAAREQGYDEGVVNHLSQLSYAYNRAGDYKQALAMAKEAVESVEKMPVVDRNLLAISLEYVAFNLLDMKRGAEAVPVIQRAIALQQEVGNMRSVCYDYKSLAEALEPDRPREAMAALRRYSSMMDSLHYAQMHEVLSQANAELHNDELTEANANSDRRGRLILLTSLGVGAMLLLVISFLLYINRLRERTNLMMEQLQTTREQFFTNITHEFRTPLTVIRGLSQQLQNADHAANVATVTAEASMIEQQGTRLLTLVNQLLDIAKVKSAIGTANWRHGNVVPLLTMVTESYAPLAQEGGVSMSFAHEDAIIEMDFVADYLQKIVGNLMTNALKHTPDGGNVCLSVSTDDGMLELTVVNSGKAIPADVLPHVFERFHAAESRDQACLGYTEARKRSDEIQPFYQASEGERTNGTGIGLSLTEQLVLAMNGTISVSSSDADGTRFFVRLPLQQKGVKVEAVFEDVDADMMLNTPTTDTNLVDSISEDSDDPRVLIVEDNKEVAYYIGNVLRQDSYQVCYAADGQEGLEKARELLPDVVVTDLMMPRMDGLELCRRLREDERTSHISIIVITALADDADQLKGFEAGANAYLAKPFNDEILRIRVKKLLEQHRLLREKFAQQMVSKQSNDSHSATDEAGSFPTSLDQHFLMKVDALIEELMTEGKANIDTLAERLFFHPRTLHRKMVALTGMSPSQYIMQYRLKQARKMLIENPRITVTEVAERCGFSDTSHFIHAFRRVYETTPFQYAKSHRAGEG